MLPRESLSLNGELSPEMKSEDPRQAIALVLVLAFLVILSGVILAFFASVTTESSAASSYAGGASARVLADSAINLFQSQLRDATSNPTEKGSSPQARAWASQPGMIRTYNVDGEPDKFYKLYSSDQLVVDGNGFAPDLLDPKWNVGIHQELYTDLNAPVAYNDPSLPPATTDEDKLKRLVFPIVNPLAEGIVDGFSINPDKRPGFEPGQSPSTANHPAPMPVKWLYMLEDGTLAPASVEGETLKVTGAKSDNPVVGRVAFWADDETAKVNINTASEGTYWDVPRIYSIEDFGRYSGRSVAKAGFSVTQPTQNEFQRYPGHPATTSLSPILGSFLPVPFPFPANPTSADATKLDPYYNIAPYVGLKDGGGGGGSKGGSVQVTETATPMENDTDRLYASVDELMFSPAFSGNFRVQNPAKSSDEKKFTRDLLEKTKFFLTANSAAPETTLNNTPRIAVWPVALNVNQRTTYDKLLAFCSTIGGKDYYFTRSNARSGTSDYQSIPRNAQLYEYLQALTTTNIPGFGGNFLQKFGVGEFATDRDQILTYIYDYIRCTNLQDESTGAKSYTPLFKPKKPGEDPGQIPGAGEVIPIKIGATQGFGRFYSVTSANLLFYGTNKEPDVKDAKGKVIKKGKVNKMRAIFFLAFTTPAQGLGAMRSNVKYKVVSGLDRLQANGASLNFKPGGTNYMDRSDLSLFHGRSVGGTESPWQAIIGKPFKDEDAGKDQRNRYPFFSALDVPVAGDSFAFASSSDIVLEVRATDTNALIQTLTFSFPPGQFAVPREVFGPLPPDQNSGFGSRKDGDYNSLVKAEDTIVSLQVAGASGNDPGPKDDSTSGDIRLVASLPDVPKDRFRAHKKYTEGSVRFAHSLVQSIGESFHEATYGKLAPVPTYRQDNVLRQPDVPSRAPNGVTRKDGGHGDWDTGFGDQKDGAYINKPDEGDTALQDPAGGTTRLPYLLGYGKGFASATNVYFSPNRQIPSPLMFGSLPTGVQRKLPWQTLLFHARPEDESHPGNKQGPKDHLMADLFWMPVVQPYAISQPFATAGKINLNYQIIPFTYIRRATGLHGLMKSTKFAALEPAIANRYKPLDRSGDLPTAPNRRRSIDINKTLQAFDDKFKTNEIFRSASQLCEMNLVPTNLTDATSASDYKTMGAFWNANRLTGDNLREKPYVDMYSRVTTKSNTFTVHVKVQSLKKARNTPPDEWVPGKDLVLSEYRGSSIIERYIDPNDPRLPDFARVFASNPNDDQLNIDKYYRMRVVSAKTFTP